MVNLVTKCLNTRHIIMWVLVKCQSEVVLVLVYVGMLINEFSL